MAIQVSYADYRDFGGVKFPTKIRQTYGGFPALELTVTEVRANGSGRHQGAGQRAAGRESDMRVQSAQGGRGGVVCDRRHAHSVVIEMKDHLIVAEGR